MKISNESLCLLLNKVKRTQTVGGKAQDQVLSCIVKCADGKATVTSLVKDGLTSVSRFSAYTDNKNDEGTFHITDIDTMLGALKYHANIVSLTQDGDKLRIKSSNKQTTLGASANALAYPHNPKTLSEWSQASEDIASRLVRDGAGIWTYKGENEKIQSAFVFKVDAVTLYEAVRCDSMNGQKINRYVFTATDGGLAVETGKMLKGKTKSLVLDSSAGNYISNAQPTHFFEATFEGGLEHLLSHYNREINLNLLDFSKHGQGWKLLFDFGDGDFVFQASIQ